MYHIRPIYPNELLHSGVKGQKWGVRRYQNQDGSLTDAGKDRYKKNVLLTYTSRGNRYVDTGKIGKLNGNNYSRLSGSGVDPDTGLPIDEIRDLYRSGVSVGAIADRFRGAIPKDVINEICGDYNDYLSYKTAVQKRTSRENSFLDSAKMEASIKTVKSMPKTKMVKSKSFVEKVKDSAIKVTESVKKTVTKILNRIK